MNMLYLLIFLIACRASCGAKVVSFLFTRNQCLENQFIPEQTDNSLGYFSSNTPGANCIFSDGVASLQKLFTRNTVSGLKSAIGDGNYAIELWIQPAFNQSQMTPIFSIGRDAVLSTPCRNNVMVNQVAGVAGKFVMVQCNANGITTGEVLTSARFVVQKTVNVPRLVHVVINVFPTVNVFGTTRVFGIAANFTINGVNTADSFHYLSSSSGSYDALKWDTWGVLNVFPSMDISSARAGHVHYVALHNQDLDSSAVNQLYAAKLPNSLPVVLNMTVSIQENGEVGDHSLQPEFYQQAIPTNELAIIRISVSDLENYAYGEPLQAKRPKLLIRALPAASKLYQVDGTEITDANADTTYVAYDTTTSSYQVRIRPPLDQFSVIANQSLDMFSYVAIDGVTGLRSVETAWMHVMVTHVNKPPIATRRSVTVLYGGYKELAMNGTDPDSAIVGAVITKNPTNGILHQYNTQRTINATTNEYTLQSGPPFRVLYEYTGPRVVDANNRVGGDSFQYCLVDVEGRRSVPVTYTVSVLSPIYSTAVVATTVNPRGVEDTRAAITLRGGDSSTERNFLNAYIVTPAKIGNVYLTASAYSPISTLTMLIGFIYRGNYTLGGIDVFYQGPENYFTTPTKTWNGTSLNRAPDSFTFKMTAASGGDSLPVTQYVHIKNVNDPSVLSVAQSSVQMRRLGDTDEDTTNADYTSNTANNSTDADSDTPVYTTDVTPGTVILSGFSVVDPDLGVDPVHIVVSTRNASTFRLNSKHLDAVDFNSAKYCQSTTVRWICDGDGTVTMASFVAAPADAVRALNGVTVILDRATLEDTLVVTMYDGVGDDCLSDAQLGTGSIYNGCYSTSVSVKIYGSGSSSVGGSSNGVSASLMGRLMYVAIALVVFMVLVAWRFFIGRRSKLSKDREDSEYVNPVDRTWLLTFKYILTGFPSRPRRRPRSTRASPGRTPKRRAHHRDRDEKSRSSDSESSGSSGSYSDSGESTAEEEYDVEAGRYRTPPRRGRRESSRASSPRVARTPQTPQMPQTTKTPKTPKTPNSSRTPKMGAGSSTASPEPTVRVETFANPYNRSLGETPTKTVIVYRDTIGADGRVETEETRVVVPVQFENERENVSSPRSRTKQSSPTKRSTPLRAFPDMRDEQSHSTPRSSKQPPLGRAPSCNTSPLRSDTRLPGKRASHTPGTPYTPSAHRRAPLDLHELREVNDFTDQSVSTMTCSVGPRSQSLLHVQPTPPRRTVASPESEASPMCTDSTRKHRSPRREEYQYNDGAGMDALAQVMRTPERVPQKHASSAGRSGGSRSTRPHGEEVSESGTKQSSVRKAKSRGERSGGEKGGVYDSGVSIAGTVWSQHEHRSGRLFYHNAETGKNTWRKPAECM